MQIFGRGFHSERSERGTPTAKKVRDYNYAFTKDADGHEVETVRSE